MKSNFFSIAIFIFFSILIAVPAFNQQPNQKKEPTREQIMHMTYEQMLNMPFSDLIHLADIVGVSTEELLQMILNKDVSSASKEKEKVFQSPLSTTVISKEELEKSGATSIAEALRLVPGMIVREKTPGNFDIHIRGNDNLPPKNMFVYSEDAISLVMIDNRPVYNYAFGGTFWETLPVDINDVERIEVIRGPSSALYGPNAVAGVINIITKHPRSAKPSANASFQYGTRNTTLANIDLTGGLSNKFKIRLSGNYAHWERFENDFYVFDLNKYLSYSQMDTLHYYWSQIPQQDTTLAEDHFTDKIINADLATNKYAANAFLFYDLSKKVNMTLRAGIQRSEIVSTTLGNHTISLIGRQSHTQYADFQSNIFGFHLQCNYMYGNQQVERGSPAWHIEPRIFNSDLEYEYRTPKLVFRPGVSYQQTVYTDKDYVDITKKEGFLNGDKKLSSMAAYVRADYKPLEKLRLIAALRADKYTIPDKSYLTYQFIATYNLNDNNLIRAVYSRANRGPFIVDSHADYHWQLVPGFYQLLWEGNQNLKLPVMDMEEIGYRTKIFDRLMVDIEAFYTQMTDFSYFSPDSMSLQMNWLPVLQQTATAPVNTGITGAIRYHNFPLKTQQMGITCNVSVVINSKLNFRVFGTLQHSEIKNFYPKTIWQEFDQMNNTNYAAIRSDGQKLASGDMNLIGSLMSANGKKVYTASGTIPASALISETNKSTPTFFGGASVDYTPLDRLNLFTSAYFYSHQTIETNKVDVSNGTYLPSQTMNASYRYKVEPKIIVDAKVSYKFWKENNVFFNARNLFNNTKKEFAYTDKIGGTYLVGLSLHF